MPRQITAFSNPLVKQARGLREKKNRRREGLFLAEGLRILTEAREAGTLPEMLFYSDSSHPLLRALIDETEQSGGSAIETVSDILHKISGKENPQSVLGVYRAPDTSLDRIDRAERALVEAAHGAETPAVEVLEDGEFTPAQALAPAEFGVEAEREAARQREVLLELRIGSQVTRVAAGRPLQVEPLVAAIRRHEGAVARIARPADGERNRCGSRTVLELVNAI